LAAEASYDLLVLPSPPAADGDGEYQKQVNRVLKNTRRPVFLAKMPEVPTEAAPD